MDMSETTPTVAGIAKRPGQFKTLIEALEYGATGQTGMNFFAGRGQLVETLSYRDLSEDGRRVGARLLGHGLKPGDRVGLVAESEADFVRAFVGCLYAGLIPCPMPLPAAFGAKGTYGDHIERIARVAQVSAVVTPAAYLDRIEEPMARSGLDLRFVSALSALDQKAEAPLPAPPHPEALAYLQFSSGTTSAPKGIAISHAALMANVEGIAFGKLDIGDQDRGVNWLPFYHDMGLVGCMLLPIGAQMSIDHLPTRDFIRQPAVWLQMISRARGTVSYAPSFGYDLAARRLRSTEGLDLSSWRIAGIGGDMVKTENLARFADAFADIGFRDTSFLASYGMAEVSLGLAFADLGRGCRAHVLDLDRLDQGIAAPGTTARSRSFAICGTPLPGHEIEIRDDHGSVLSEGRIGTVFGRGPSMMQGYFGDPKATAEALDAEGWLNTGDLGFLQDGELVLTGRAKDLIIVNGRNIWPQDIEWTVERQVGGAREGGVVAFGSAGSADSEEEVTVVIECRTAEDARESLRQETDAVVREIHGVIPRIALSKPGLLPRTSSGKLSRARARAMYQSGDFNL